MISLTLAGFVLVIATCSEILSYRAYRKRLALHESIEPESKWVTVLRLVRPVLVASLVWVLAEQVKHRAIEKHLREEEIEADG